MSTEYTYNTAAQEGVAITSSILAATNLIGNSLVILIIVNNKSMKSPMNYLLVNLAVADMMVGLFLTPQYVLIHLFTHPDGLTGTILCKLLTGGIFAWVGCVASSFSLVAICLERYFAIVHPYSIKFKLNMGKLKFVVIICWLFAVAINFPSFWTIVYQNGNVCIEKWSSEKWLSRAYSMLWVIFLGIIPIAIMVVLYSRVIYTLWFKRSEHQVQGTQLAMLKSRKRVTKMVVIVSVIYAVCWFPVLLAYCLYHYGVHFSLFGVVMIVCNVLALSNSAVNPFIYGLQSQKFRNYLKELVCCKKRFQNQIFNYNQGHNSARNRAYNLQTGRRITKNSN